MDECPDSIRDSPIIYILRSHHPDDLVKIVCSFDGRVAEIALVVLVLVDRYVRVLKLVTGQDAGDGFIFIDDAVF